MQEKIREIMANLNSDLKEVSPTEDLLAAGLILLILFLWFWSWKMHLGLRLRPRKLWRRISLPLPASKL